MLFQCRDNGHNNKGSERLYFIFSTRQHSKFVLLRWFYAPTSNMACEDKLHQKSNLSCVKEIANIYAEVTLKPNNISICSMHNLVKLNLFMLQQSYTRGSVERNFRHFGGNLFLFRVFEDIPEICTNVIPKLECIDYIILRSGRYLHQAC